jgi:hypothetical protein
MIACRLLVGEREISTHQPEIVFSGFGNMSEDSDMADCSTKGILVSILGITHLKIINYSISFAAGYTQLTFD